MRPGICLRVLLVALAFAAPACTSATSPAATLTITTPPDFSGSVAKAELESGNGPAGPYAQYDLWVIVPPAPTANAGVVVPNSAPVFLRRGSSLVTSRASEIRVGDRIDVWRDPILVAYGAVQGPAGAPTYSGTQIVIVR
jgi:hypothetical protein